MSEPLVPPSTPQPQSAPFTPTSTPTPAPPTPAAVRSSFLSVALTFSFLFNCGAVVVLATVCAGVLLYGGVSIGDSANVPLTETVYSGKATAKDKIAIIHVEGVIMEGLLRYPHKQIEQAAEDKDVKAVVLRINSPGGSITGSDDLYRRLVDLRDGTTAGKSGARKPLVVSMGSLAASGGYYIAAPGHTIVAERTTMTGSIGVYSAFPNISGLAKKYEFGITTIKQGEIKDSGSPFKEMSPHEERVWQDMVDHAYLQFIEVVQDGRGDKIKPDTIKPGSLLDEFVVTPTEAQKALKHPAAGGSYKRYLADGGIYTADQARKHGLIDSIGTLDDAIAIAQREAGLGLEFKAIEYERPKPFALRLLGVQARPANNGLLDPGQVKNGFVPRLWYLMPGSEVSGLLAGMESREE